MRKLVGLTLIAMLVFASVAGAVPDPWRIKVSDLDKTTPYIAASAWVCEVLSDSSVGTWGASGGKFQWYWWWGGAACTGGADTGLSVASYNAATGALSFGASVATSVEAWGVKSCRDVIKVGSVYKGWRWTGEYNGTDVVYYTSTDGTNFSVYTRTTIYGPTVTSTGIYGYGGSRTSGGVYVFLHRNSGAAYQNAGSKGIMTSGVGETEWWDIDTNQPDSILPPTYNFGDPIADPHTMGTTFLDLNNYQSIRKACNGSLFSPLGGFREYPAPVVEAGLGLAIGTAGEISGGDDWVWLSDIDNLNTQGIANSLLGAIGLDGLGGPSLKAHVNGFWTGWSAKILPLASGGDMAPAAKFAMFYDAAWDTDSSGSGYDFDGFGRATLYLTRNKADLNYDGTVNFSDISPFSTAYGSTSGLNSNYNKDCDFNGSGKVDFSDVSPLSSRYGSNCSYGQ